MDSNDYVKEWFLHSYNNLISAKHLFNDLYPKQIDISCYLSQQCAETALKGILVYKDYEPPKIHNLRELCELCMQYDATFQTIFAYCQDLTKYSNITRYPNELETDEIAAKSATEKAKTIYEFCLNKVPNECKPDILEEII